MNADAQTIIRAACRQLARDMADAYEERVAICMVENVPADRAEEIATKQLEDYRG